MEQNHSIKLFEDKRVRVQWDEKHEKWYFSIIDIISVLTDNDFQGARNYWKVLKHRLKEEGNESVTNCNQLKMKSSDGKFYLTDVGDTEQVLRLVQSIPSKKAEPFKIWLAKVGYERIEETEDPELAFNRAMKTYMQKGYSKEWINYVLTQTLKNFELFNYLLIMVCKGRRLAEKQDGKPPRKVYKSLYRSNISNLRIVSMIPGDRKVAGCLFYSFSLFRGIC
ncbi:hypothetical protein J4416_00060 [Candidatus Pacearchaeota archaeon]|nr:hypothetical protein [Candidatus Pacearchaeota archaeon]